nr:MAG TPA: hypothetical protein [Caudoviricetes sp.]
MQAKNRHNNQSVKTLHSVLHTSVYGATLLRRTPSRGIIFFHMNG